MNRNRLYCFKRKAPPGTPKIIKHPQTFFAQRKIKYEMLIQLTVDYNKGAMRDIIQWWFA